MRPKATTGRWFLIRGLVREAGHWGNFPKELSTAFAGAAVDCLDTLGNGTEYRKKSPLTISAMVDAIRDRYLSLVDSNPETPNYLLAISMGGMIALDWVSRFPNDFAGAVLINTSLRGVSPFHQRLQPSSWLTVAKLLVEADSLVRESEILHLTTRLIDETAIAKLAEVHVQQFEARPIRRVNALRQLAAAARFYVPKERPNLPLLVLNSLNDDLVNPACSTELAERWKLEIHQHQLAGHDLTLDDPQWVVDALKKWQAAL